MLLFLGAYIGVQISSVKPTDGLFYLFIGIGIMVASGARGIQSIFVIAGGYSLLEYLLFVEL